MTERLQMHGPVVNLNGASRDVLLRAHMLVLRQAKELFQTMMHNTPHGRDYQTARDPVHYTHDRNVFEFMLHDLHNIISQYERIAERLATEAE